MSSIALKQCCLVSKSWIPRTRRHLFAELKFRHERHLETWKKMFPGPSTSPAHFAKSLLVGCARAVTPADAEPGGWLTSFAHIVHLEVWPREMHHGHSKAVSLVPFHGFSRTINSLHVKSVDLSPSRIFDFILPSPRLEDLSLAGCGVSVDGDDGPPSFTRSSNLPVLTGSLNLCLKDGMEPIAGRLLSIPAGIHFRKLAFTWHCREDLLPIIALVRECSHTLESLNIACTLHGTSIRCLDLHR